MRVRRLLLFSLVAMNLTLVCQGHAADGSHTGVHLALLGEPHIENEGAHPPAEMLPGQAAGAHEPGHFAEYAKSIVRFTVLPNLPVEEAGRNGDPALLAGNHFSSLNTLAFMLLGTVAGASHGFSMCLVKRKRLLSRYKQAPEPPPPRTHA